MGLSVIPGDVQARYQIEERRHACAIFAADFPTEFADLIECLRRFELVRSEVTAPGGGKTKIAARFDRFLADPKRGWTPKRTAVAMTVNGVEKKLETHEVDLCHDAVAVEVQWNNKDPFFSRDLNAFRLLHELGIISVGVIITRCDELQALFDSLGWVKDKKRQMAESRHKVRRLHDALG